MGIGPLDGGRQFKLLCTASPNQLKATLWDAVNTLRASAVDRATGRATVSQRNDFVSRDLDLWACANDVILDFSRPSKPTDNAFIEAFNGRLRAECLNAHCLTSLGDAREKLEAWRRDYNKVRPRGAIGNKSPIAFMKSIGATNLPRAKTAQKSIAE